MGDVDGKELIVLIHGTGSSEPAPEGQPRFWWEGGSAFAQALMGRLDPGRYDLAPPFTWSGANSETVRRTAGAALEKQLRDWDKQGRKYHLVGHSHGGSVIWHALVRSRRSGKPLSGLITWTTVGTPYLEFQPDLLSLWPIAPLVATVAAAWSLWSGNPDLINSVVGAWTYGDARWLLGVLGAVLVILALLAIWGFWSVAGLLPAAIGQARLRQAEARARRDYAGRSLMLFHREDEPINGIAISLRPPGEIFPRATADSRHPVWQRAVIAMRRTIANLYAPTLDQLVWDVVAQRVQGDDLAQDRMISVSPRPRQFVPAATGFTDEEGVPYATAADAGASGIARNARQLLLDLATGKTKELNAQQLAHIIDWSGIIHTSYFGFDLTRQRIADWIGRAVPPTVAVGEPLAPRTNRYRPWLMTAVLAVIGTAFAGGLWAIATLMIGNLISPYSKQGFVERVAAQYSDPLLAAVENSDLPGQLLVKLETLPQFGLHDVVTSPSTVLATLPNIDSQYRSAAIYVDAQTMQARGDSASVNAFIADYMRQLSVTDPAKLTLEQNLLELYTLEASTRQASYADQYTTENTARFDAALSALEQDAAFGRRTVDVARAIVIAERLGRSDQVSRLAVQLGQTYSCANARAMALALVDDGDPTDAGALVNTCTAPAMAAAVLRLAGDRRATDPVGDLSALLSRMLEEDSATVLMPLKGDISTLRAPPARVRAAMLDIAAAQDRQDFDAASESLRKFTAMTGTTPGLLIGNSQSWITLERNFQGWDYAVAADMLGALLADYRSVVMDKTRLSEASIPQTEALVNSMMDTTHDPRLSALALYWESKAESAEPDVRAAMFTQVGIAYLALSAYQDVEPSGVSDMFKSALDALPVLRVDRPGFAVAIAEKVAELGSNPELLERAIGVATDEALKTQDFQRRAQYLGRIASLEIGRQNYPAGLRLIDAAGVPQERFRSLVLLNGKLFSRMAGEDTSEVRWSEGLSNVATTWLVEPQPDDSP